jgi:hypothetical protein
MAVDIDDRAVRRRGRGFALPPSGRDCPENHRTSDNPTRSGNHCGQHWRRS